MTTLAVADLDRRERFTALARSLKTAEDEVLEAAHYVVRSANAGGLELGPRIRILAAALDARDEAQRALECLQVVP